MRPDPALAGSPGAPLTRTVVLATGMTITLGCRIPPTPEAVPLQVRLRDQRLEPAELRLPAGVPAVLTFSNEGGTSGEIEGDWLLPPGRTVAPGERISIRVPPLAPGRYALAATSRRVRAQGILVVAPGADTEA